MEENLDLLRNYDIICAAAFSTMLEVSKNSDTVAIGYFDPKDEEHLFVLGVAKGLGGATRRPVCIDVNRFQLWKLNRGLDKDCRMRRMNGKEAIYSINPNILLKGIRAKAKELCGEGFSFADIYNEYYKRKKGK